MKIFFKNNNSKGQLQLLKLAAFAALLATLGDFVFMYLFVLDTSAMELNTVKAMLWVGGVLGVIAIPFYAIGYWAISSIIFASNNISSKLFISIAIVASLSGAAIHGITPTMH